MTPAITDCFSSRPPGSSFLGAVFCPLSRVLRNKKEPAGCSDDPMNGKTAGVFLIALLCATAGRAEIALLSNGRALKVDDWTIARDSISLALSSGGLVTMPIDRVERIVDDEIVPVEEIPPSSSLFPPRSWKFDEEGRVLFESPYDELIVDASKRFDVDPSLISAIIKAESNYDARAVSKKGARGLMQLMPATAERFGVTDPFDPEANIFAGTRYVRRLLDEFSSDPELALAAYNSGEGTVRRYDGVPPYRETVDYLKRISGYFEVGSPVASGN